MNQIFTVPCLKLQFYCAKVNNVCGTDTERRKIRQRKNGNGCAFLFRRRPAAFRRSGKRIRHWTLRLKKKFHARSTSKLSASPRVTANAGYQIDEPNRRPPLMLI